jgi:hypothetical protein
VLARIVAALAILAILALYLYWTARRLDRLHARADAAATALDSQLARRGVHVLEFCDAVALPSGVADQLRVAVAAASFVPGLGHDREVVENAVTHALTKAIDRSRPSFEAPSAAASGLHDEALRASFARGFYNDAVRDALVIRDRRLVRWLRLAGRAPHPAYFEMSDEELPAPPHEIPLAATRPPPIPNSAGTPE